MRYAINILCYRHFINYLTSYDLQEFKDLSKPQNKDHNKRQGKRHTLFHSQ